MHETMLRKAMLTNDFSPFQSAAASSLQMSVFAGKSMKDIDGKVVQLDQVTKKVTLVVNVACFCGLTRHYPGLQELQV